MQAAVRAAPDRAGTELAAGEVRVAGHWRRARARFLKSAFVVLQHSVVHHHEGMAFAIIYGQKYITAQHAARQVLAFRRPQANYLESVTRWHQLREMSRCFADALGREELAEPEAYLEYYRQHWEELC
jgi:hypothetical protein